MRAAEGIERFEEDYGADLPLIVVPLAMYPRAETQEASLFWWAGQD